MWGKREASAENALFVEKKIAGKKYLGAVEPAELGPSAASAHSTASALLPRQNPGPTVIPGETLPRRNFLLLSELQHSNPIVRQTQAESGSKSPSESRLTPPHSS